MATVKDARPHIGPFLDSLAAQTRRPDEAVVVDGGSTDGTWEVLRDAPGILAIQEPGANISRGRNLGIAKASHDVIAVTDADCILAPDWLERLLEPVGRGADVSAGFYQPLPASLLDVCVSAHIPEPREITRGWLPSSRSIAFTREAFDAVGGYPEWLRIGEDMFFNHRLREWGAKIETAPEAIAYWRVGDSVADTWRRYAGYAEGDAVASMYPRRHAIRFATYLSLGAVLASRRRLPMALAAVAGAAYVSKPVGRAWNRLVSPRHRAAALVGVPLATAFIDAAKMWGYLRGLRRGKPQQP